MIVRAKILIPMDGPPIENGAVIVSGERIRTVGKFPELRKEYAHEEIVDLGEQALLPGLINAHCHLDYTCMRGKISRQKSFADWILAINAEKAKLSPQDYIASINQGFAEAKRFGTTTIANLTAFPELVSQVEPSIRTWWFAELIDIRDSSRAKQIVDLAVEQLKTQKHWGLAPHAPFTASADLYRLSARAAPLLTTHLAESREEMSMFCNAKGKLFEFLKEIGRDMKDCRGTTPIERFTEMFRDVSTSLDMTKDWILTHLNEICAQDLDLLRKSKPNVSIVHCPRSRAYFDHSPFQFQKLRQFGLNVCLGTDSLASNQDLSLFAEMRSFQKEFPDISPEEILALVTINSAQALGSEHALGKISAEFLADLIAIPVAGSALLFEEVVAFERPVNWSMIGVRIAA